VTDTQNFLTVAYSIIILLLLLLVLLLLSVYYNKNTDNQRHGKTILLLLVPLLLTTITKNYYCPRESIASISLQLQKVKISFNLQGGPKK